MIRESTLAALRTDERRQLPLLEAALRRRAQPVELLAALLLEPLEPLRLEAAS